jgi:hypothetical protein
MAHKTLGGRGQNLKSPGPSRTLSPNFSHNILTLVESTMDLKMGTTGPMDCGPEGARSKTRTSHNDEKANNSEDELPCGERDYI